MATEQNEEFINYYLRDLELFDAWRDVVFSPSYVSQHADILERSDEEKAVLAHLREQDEAISAQRKGLLIEFVDRYADKRIKFTSLGIKNFEKPVRHSTLSLREATRTYGQATGTLALRNPPLKHDTLGDGIGEYRVNMRSPLVPRFDYLVTTVLAYAEEEQYREDEQIGRYLSGIRHINLPIPVVKVEFLD